MPGEPAGDAARGATPGSPGGRRRTDGGGRSDRPAVPPRGLGRARRAARRALPAGRGRCAAHRRVVPVRPGVEAARCARAARRGGRGRRHGRLDAAAGADGLDPGRLHVRLPRAAAGRGRAGLRPVLRADVRVDAGRGHGPGRAASAPDPPVRLGLGERARGARPHGGHGQRGRGAVPDGAAPLLGGRHRAGALGDGGLDGGVPGRARAAGDAVAGGLRGRPDANIPPARFPLPPGTRPNMPRQRPPEQPR